MLSGESNTLVEPDSMCSLCKPCVIRLCIRYVTSTYCSYSDLIERLCYEYALTI